MLNIGQISLIDAIEPLNFVFTFFLSLKPTLILNEYRTRINYENFFECNFKKIIGIKKSIGNLENLLEIVIKCWQHSY